MTSALLFLAHGWNGALDRAVESSSAGGLRPRRDRIGTPCVLLLASLALAACNTERATDPDSLPNILLVTIDTLRADHTSVYGYPVQTTPNLERLAREGMLFGSMYSASATTAPSHAALLTGQSQRSLGVLKNGHVLHDTFTTLAELLAATGYQTAAFVSSRPVYSRYGFDQGFHHYDEEAGDDKNLKQDESAPHSRRADEATRALLDWLEAREDPRPLFVWLHFFDPHFPYAPPETFDGDWPPDTKGFVVGYDSEIRYADLHLGRVVDALDAIEGADGTIVTVTSDHGEGLGEHGRRGHGPNLHDEAVRIPLIVRWRGRLAAGQTIESTATLIDVAPTILELIGIKPPEWFQGKNITHEVPAKRSVFLQRRSYPQRRESKTLRGEMTAVVQEHWKYIHAPDEARYELYDTLDDPAELVNLATTMAAKRDRLERALQGWMRDHPKPDIEQPELSADDKAALRALGYVE